MKKFVIVIFLISLLLLTNVVLATTGTVNTQGLNLRDGASTYGTNIIVKIDKNEVLNIEEDLGEWYKVNYKDYSGYVSKQYVDLNEEDNTKVSDTLEAGHGRILSDTTVYVLPLINSTQISSLKQGADVVIISEVGQWKFIQTQDLSGWVIASKVEGSLKGDSNEQKPEENENNTQNNEVNNEVTEENQNTNTVDTSNENNGEEENVGSITFPTSLYVNVDAVNIREDATTDSNVVTSVGLNTPVRVTGEKGDWYKVEVSDGKGYMMKKYLSPEER